MSQDKDSSEVREDAVENQSCCDGGSCCPSGSEGGSNRWKTAVFILVVVTAGAVLANSLVKRARTDADRSQATFAATPLNNMADTLIPSTPAAKAETPADAGTEVTAAVAAPAVATEEPEEPGEAAPSVWKAQLDSLASLNQVAADADGVFVVLGPGGPLSMAPVAGQIEAAVNQIAPNGVKISVFRLKESAPEFDRIAEQISIPCVIAMVKGRGVSTVSGEISAARLVQAFVTASRPTAGCCPPGSTSTTCPPQ